MKGILTAHVKTQFNCGKNIIKAYKNKEATNKNFKNIKTYVKNKEGNKKGTTDSIPFCIRGAVHFLAGNCKIISFI